SRRWSPQRPPRPPSPPRSKSKPPSRAPDPESAPQSRPNRSAYERSPRTHRNSGFRIAPGAPPLQRTPPATNRARRKRRDRVFEKQAVRTGLSARRRIGPFRQTPFRLEEAL